MSSISDLIEVNYTDVTNHVTITSGDILGTPFEYYWGPVNQMLTLNRQDFERLYPNSPAAVSNDTVGAGGEMPVTAFNGYQQIINFFDAGGTTVEVYRIMPSGMNNVWGIKSVGGTTKGGQTVSYKNRNDEAVIFVKYPGILPMSLKADRTKHIYCHINQDPNGVVTVKVGEATVESDVVTFTNVYEQFIGALDASKKGMGINTIFAEVNNKSQYVAMSDNPGMYAGLGTITDWYFDVEHFNNWGCYASPEVSDYINVITGYFDDTLLSNCTLLIDGLDPSVDSSSQYRKAIQNCANDRKDCMAVIPSYANGMKEGAIKTDLANIIKDKYSIYLACREASYLWNTYSLTSTGVGTFAGCTARVASQVRVNQVASAFVYGQFPGKLTEALSFSDAKSLMNEFGVTSVVETNTGNMIWGVRDLYEYQDSYFAKMNVMRVIADILRNCFPIALTALHTDAASNPVTRANFNTRFNNIINNEIANQNLASDSYADTLNCNSDAETQGGKILNVLLSCHFYGLAEKVKINIVATDNSVTANIQ